MTIYKRADRVLFKISGADAGKLLKDTLTGYVEETADAARWNALLTPQGKIVAEGLLGWADGAFWYDVHAESAEGFFKMMRLYKMRAAVDIEDAGESHCVGWTESQVSNSKVHRDPRGGGNGFRIIATRSEAQDWSDESQAYDKHRIARGVVEVGADYPPSSLFAHDIGMDFNDGISFLKGCYIGQEVVSRMKHRGTARRRPVIVGNVKGSRGDTVNVDGRSTGELGDVVGGMAVAVLRIDRIPPGSVATVNDAPVTLALPEWASYRFEDSETA